jgi:nucleoside-diphosphate-sugar epimerase
MNLSRAPQHILVTGSSGFVAGHLIAHLSQASRRVTGTSRTAPTPSRRALLHEHVVADLTSEVEVRALVERARPDAIVHLAYQRSGELAALLRANTLATELLLRVTREALGPGVPVVVVGSASEIGAGGGAGPLDESIACLPVDAHGISKLAQSLVALSAQLQHGQHTVRLRLFNLLGPGLPPTLLPGRAVELFATAARTRASVMLMFGDLGSARDYLDVRDAARAIGLALDGGAAGRLYHVGSGRALTGAFLLESLRALGGDELKQLSYQQSAAAPSLIRQQLADAGLAHRELSFCPEISAERSLEDMWRFARTGA